MFFLVARDEVEYLPFLHNSVSPSTAFGLKVTDTLTPRSGKLNKICEREVEMYLER